MDYSCQCKSFWCERTDYFFSARSTQRSKTRSKLRWVMEVYPALVTAAAAQWQKALAGCERRRPCGYCKQGPRTPQGCLRIRSLAIADGTARHVSWWLHSGSAQKIKGRIKDWCNARTLVGVLLVQKHRYNKRLRLQNYRLAHHATKRTNVLHLR